MSKIIADKYKVIRELGEGAYSVVYLVQHTDANLTYALKVLKRSVSDQTNFIERFKQEAGLIQRFQHPGMLQLRDFGRTENGNYYMATDFSDGVPLEKIMEREGAFAVPRALDLMIQLLEVLGAAHQLGIVHRDIKPANIMLEKAQDGRDVVKILDFGIAKIKEDIPIDSRTTTEGVSIGTPAYMSPEQCTAEADVDHRADLYSAGIVMFEMLSAEVPFIGSTVVQTLLKHLTQPPPPFPAKFSIPDYISRIVHKALEKEKEQRFSDAAAFKLACREALLRWEKKATKIDDAPAAAGVQASEDSDMSEVQVKKLLCLDDNEMILQISRHIFEREGYRVFTATNFSTIHDLIFLEKVPLLLCDVNMPGLPGNKICKMLKQVKPSLKIVLFSNIPDRDLEKLAASCGADGWLSKNSHPQDWLAKVKEFEAP